MADPIPPQFRDNESWLWIQEATVEIYYPGTSVIKVSWPIDSLQDCRYRDDVWLRADSIDYWTLMNLLDTYADTIPWDDDIHELCWSPIKPGPENGYLVNQSHHDEVHIDEDNFALTMVEAIDTFCGYRPQPGGRPYRGEISIYCIVRPKGYCSIDSVSRDAEDLTGTGTVWQVEDDGEFEGHITRSITLCLSMPGNG